MQSPNSPQESQKQSKNIPALLSPACDSLVQEYLLFRGFLSTYQEMKNQLADRKSSIRGNEYDPESIITVCKEFINNGDTIGLFDFWNTLNQHYFSRLESDQSLTIHRIKISLFRCFLVNCSETNKISLIEAFFKDYQYSSLLKTNPEYWKEWYRLSFCQNPSNDSYFRLYFSEKWKNTFWSSFSNFLSVVFLHMPLPRLFYVPLQSTEYENLYEKYQKLSSDYLSLKSRSTLFESSSPVHSLELDIKSRSNNNTPPHLFRRPLSSPRTNQSPKVHNDISSSSVSGLNFSIGTRDNSEEDDNLSPSEPSKPSDVDMMIMSLTNSVPKNVTIPHNDPFLAPNSINPPPTSSKSAIRSIAIPKPSSKESSNQLKEPVVDIKNFQRFMWDWNSVSKPFLRFKSKSLFEKFQYDDSSNPVPITHLSFSPSNADWLAVGRRDSVVTLYNQSTSPLNISQLVFSFERNNSKNASCTSMKWIKNDQLLVGSSTGNVHVFSTVHLTTKVLDSDSMNDSPNLIGTSAPSTSSNAPEVSFFRRLFPTVKPAPNKQASQSDFSIESVGDPSYMTNAPTTKQMTPIQSKKTDEFYSTPPTSNHVPTSSFQHSKRHPFSSFSLLPSSKHKMQVVCLESLPDSTHFIASLTQDPGSETTSVFSQYLKSQTSLPKYLDWRNPFGTQILKQSAFNVGQIHPDAPLPTSQGILGLWDIVKQIPVFTFPLEPVQTRIHCISSINQTTIVTGAADGFLRLFDIRKPQFLLGQSLSEQVVSVIVGDNLEVYALTLDGNLYKIEFRNNQSILVADNVTKQKLYSTSTRSTVGHSGTTGIQYSTPLCTTGSGTWIPPGLRIHPKTRDKFLGYAGGRDFGYFHSEPRFAFHPVSSMTSPRPTKPQYSWQVYEPGTSWPYNAHEPLGAAPIFKPNTQSSVEFSIKRKSRRNNGFFVPSRPLYPTVDVTGVLNGSSLSLWRQSFLSDSRQNSDSISINYNSNADFIDQPRELITRHLDIENGNPYLVVNSLDSKTPYNPKLANDYLYPPDLFLKKSTSVEFDPEEPSIDPPEIFEQAPWLPDWIHPQSHQISHRIPLNNDFFAPIITADWSLRSGVSHIALGQSNGLVSVLQVSNI